MICKNSRKFWALLAFLMMLMSSADIAWGQTATTNDVTDIAAYSATGNGQISGNYTNQVTERGICWGTSQNPTITGTHGSNGSGAGTYSVEMTDLTPNTTYYVRAYGIRNGNPFYGTQRSFTTLIALPEVTTVGAIHIMSNYAVGLGNVTFDGNDPDPVVRGVCWTTSDTEPPTIENSNYATSGTGLGNYSVEMTGLEPNTIYYLRAFAQNSVGTAYGAVKTFYTSVHMQNGTVEVDNEFTFTDSEADDGWYVHNEDYTLVFIPENANNGVKIEFESLLINNDFLYFYDGDISDNNLIGVFTCNEYHAYQHGDDSQISVFGMSGNIFTVTSHSYMTVRFVSDYHWRDAGWVAHVSQVPFTPQPPAMAKLACTNDQFVLIPTSKGQHSTTLKYSYAINGGQLGEPDTEYTVGTPIIINETYTWIQFKVVTEIKESDDANAETISSVTKVYTFGNASRIQPPIAPDITLIEGTSSVTISVVRPGDLNDTWKILYTLDGTDPSSSATAQAITATTEDPNTYEVTTSDTVALHDFCTVKAVVQGTTCPDIYSVISEYEYTCGDGKIKLLPPTITFVPHDNDISKAHTTITPSTSGCTIHFNVNDGPVNVYHDYDSIIEVNANDRVKAWVSKGDPDCYDDSEPTISTYLPGSDIPGGGSGLFGKVVYLDDREPHSWSYYSKGDQPVHSLHPADVKITYFGFGNSTMTTTNNGNNLVIQDFDGNVAPDAVAVGPGAPGNQFVYFETLEAGRYSIDNSGYINLEPDYDGANHDYPYTTIPNPFSVRPKYEGPSTSTVYVNGRSWNNQNSNNGLIRVDYIDANGNAQYWQRTGNSGNVNTTITVLDGTTLTLTAVGAYYPDGQSNITARYNNASGTQIATVQCGWYGEQVIAQGTVGSAGGEDYRGFYAWRVKRLKGVTIKDAYGTTYDEEENPIIPAETRLLFHIENEYNNEVDFEALWAKAYVVTSNTASGLNANSYERNFVVGLNNIGNALNVPVTYSSYYPDGTQVYNGNVNIGDFTCGADTKFEYMNLRRNNNNTNNAITANNHYLCFGRGINPNNQYVARIVQGIGFGSQVGDLNYTIRVESGRYAQDNAQFGTNRGSRFSFVYDGNNSEGWSQVTGRYQVKSILGCDYDRAQGVNDNLFVANSTKIFYSYQCNFSSNRNMDKETFNLVVKSGTYQQGYWDDPNNGDYLWSFYCGQNNSEEENNAHRDTYPGIRYVVVEGGLMGSMNGGNGTRRTYTATHEELASSIRIKGGTFHGSVFGGAANTRSTASRRIVVTSSEIQGWIAGGSNGTDTDRDKAIIDGDTYIYVGGDAIVGGDNAKRIGPLDLANGKTPSNGGQIFGASRGNAGQRACADHSYVVVADDAKVYNNNNDPRFEPGGNVYGGGDHGYIMQKANVYILGGEIGRHVFGGAYNHHIDNYNTDIPATRVYIRGGVVKGSVHGGSNSYGNIGGVNDLGEQDAVVEMIGGIVGTEGSFVDGKVFGGGYGANADVLSNTFVTINGGLVVNNVYGGGNQGSVGVRNNNNTGKATVTIQGGQIGDIHSDDNPTKGNVYGGGKGLAHQAILTDPDKTTVNETEVNIIGSNIMGSVFGGGENGFVYTNTLVTVEGGQVGGYPGETSGGEHQDCDNPYHGSVYGGGSGMNFENGEVVQCYPEDGWVMGNTTVNIVSGAHVMRNVYGGSNVASVGLFQTDGNGDASLDANGYYIPTPNTGLATVNISGGIIGTTGTDYDAQGHAKGLANGMVYGGTHGRAILSDQDFMKFANVNNTHVIIAAGADIRGSVFGGGEDGKVLDSTFVEIIDGTIGATLTAEENHVDPDGSGMTIFRGNVYGGGRGLDSIKPSGSDTYTLRKDAGFVKKNTRVVMTGGLVRHNVYGGGSLASVGVPEDATTGRATVIVSGGQVGTSGANNGSVFGSGRGMPVKQNSANDYSEFAFVKNTFVTIDGTAKVKRSVFGGGENGHVRQKTKVDIKSGTIGITNKTVDFFKYAGNVYGGGRGVDHTNAYEYGISPTAGKVNVETEVNVTGGNIYRNVYGGGSMASVGEVMEDNNGNTLYYYYNENGEQSTTNPNAQGVPTDTYLKPKTGTGYENNGNTHVVISGGEIGIDGDENGHVFGSARGLSGSQYKHLSYAGTTDVRIIGNAKIRGSVFGSGEDGHVLKDTYVLITDNCVIGTNGHTGYEGNVYGGGRGLDLDVSGHLSQTAGKTIGNTVVDVKKNCWVKGSVFGGGRLASVGIADETPDSNGNYHTGHTMVTISGSAEIGTLTSDHPEETIGGNVYGGGKGFAGTAFKYFTYTKNTHVLIEENAKIHGSVFGSGEDGHTRQTTIVDIEGGEIGDRESECKDRFHGNVYGGGRGIDRDENGNFSWTAGRTNWSTEVNVKGGRVFRNVYGGGNIASVGMVLIDPDEDTVMLRPNGISTGAPYDVVPIDKFGHPRYTYTKDSNGNITWATDPNPEYGTVDGDPSTYSEDNLTGWARVNIKGGVVGSIEDQDHEHGNVFGSCHGKAGAEYQHLSYVNNTNVHVDYGEELPEGDANNIIQGSVFGGGEDGHVIMHTKVTVNNGKIGSKENDDKKGNVYGGGRGIDMDEHGNISPSAGLVKGHTRVYINGGYISNSVFAGANASAVWQEKVANINGGTVKGSVYGGSKNVPLNRLRRGMKTVNVRNGHIYGNVYGCSHGSTDGMDEVHPTLGNFSWTAFVNVSGGIIDGSVHGAGFASLVNGSTCICIGRNAIIYSKDKPENLYYNDKGGEEPENVTNGTTTVEPRVDNPLIIRGSVYGGSDYYTSEGSVDWSHTDVNGITNMLIDGKGYNTTTQDEEATGYMSIDGGLFGCSTHCESGSLGRHILLRNYGTRNVNTTGLGNEMTSATRTLTTIQRCNDLIIDNANVNLSGMSDITEQSIHNYAVLHVDDTLTMANASAFNLGSQSAPAYMDSIYAVRSLHMMEGDSIYKDYLYLSGKRNWEWIGVAPLNPNPDNISDTTYNSPNNARLYYYRGLDSEQTPLTYDEENVILFNGDSRLWVRYHDKAQGGIQLYGELQGFFRMKSPFPTYGTESFAYARPKTTENNNNLPQIEGHYPYINLSDGGFLSYEIFKNFFTKIGNYGGWYYQTSGDDGGTEYTRTKQYPYTNVLKISRGNNVVQYREWVIPEFRGKRWYVDGRGVGNNNGGWGMDKRHQQGWGHYPDMPKETVSGGAIASDTLHMGGICYDIEDFDGGYDIFHPAEDIIYVVGPISAAKEKNTTNNDVGSTEMNRWPEQYSLRLYRYPGGHKMSNGQIDKTVSTDQAPAPKNAYYTGFGFGPSMNLDTVNGPGANVNAMLNVEENESLIMNNVFMDGLYDYQEQEISYHEIPITTFGKELSRVYEPLAVTYPNATLSMTGSVPRDENLVTKYGTVLQRGCNNTNADVWYTDVDYNGNVHHGGAIYVDKQATVNVEKLVTADDSKQLLKLNETITFLDCNVYLPTFAKHLYITETLNEGSIIGVTSPIRNTSYHYVHNTFSPVAVANKEEPHDGENQVIAQSAWDNNNFLDDQQWFFVNHHSLNKHKDTYYATSILDYEYPYTDADAVVNHFDPEKTVFFGWTWANVVRVQPTTGYSVNGNNISVSTAKGLAWLISVVNGLNMQNPTPLTDVTITQTDDFNLQPYVWVPIGALKSNCSTFGGTYDGQGHLIDYMDIAYIGDGDRRYERLNYGLFGGVDGGKINRTFVTSGYVYPVGTANIGGLVGSLDGATGIISNSEASVDIHSPENSLEAIGGLVGVMKNGTIHSSMSTSILNSTANNVIGGLVGKSETTATKIYNSYSNVKYLMSGESPTIGGIIGINQNTTIQNCYVHLQEGYQGLNNFALLVGESDGGAVSKCYVQTTTENFPLSKSLLPDQDQFVTDCYKYSNVMGANNLGYMYYDNVVENDTTLYTRLNLNAAQLNGSSKTYSYWARPAIPEINGDLPILRLCDEDGTALHQGNFRSVGTYRGGYPLKGAFPEEDNNPYMVLQYGGPIRDERQLDVMLDRMTTRDYLFVYGDVTEQVALSTVAGKVSIYEDAAIQHPGELANGYNNTYVGISFDNSCGKAYSTLGINHLDSKLLPRDWHMFSSPLRNAPLGFDYIFNGVNTNTESYNGEDYGPYYNNPWPYLDGQSSENNEYHWLNGGTTGDRRYWMKTFNSTNQKTDGYFPELRHEMFNKEDGYPNLEAYPKMFIEESDEYPGVNRFRYPYGMDMFCWYEEEPQWVNFKRNGPNHWHGDHTFVDSEHIHKHLTYKEDNKTNQNEDSLMIGKGYMASISIMTQLQSHGTLTADEQIRAVTRNGNSCKGWNLIGNPYHSYLDFDEFARINRNIDASYVIYNADGYGQDEQSAYSGDQPRSAFKVYPAGGSNGGDYAKQYLHPHQGFFILLRSGNEVTFTEGDMVATRNDANDAGNFRNWKPNYPLVNLYLNSEKGCADLTTVEFHRPEWGGARKLRELRQGNGLFYAYHDGEPYAALFTKEGTTRVPLWFEPKEDDIYTISWNMANGYFTSLYLIDNLTGIQYDMLENDSYVFEGHKQDYASRFYISFECTDVEEHEEEVDNTFAFFDGSQWVVTGEGMLDLIDLQGRILWQRKISGGQSRVSLPNVAKSMYLLRLVNSKETKIQKIIAE